MKIVGLRRAFRKRLVMTQILIFGWKPGLGQFLYVTGLKDFCICLFIRSGSGIYIIWGGEWIIVVDLGGVGRGV